MLQKNIGSVTLPLGQSPWGRYLVEMQAVFVALPLIIANIARMSPDRTAVEFGVGAASLTSTALLIGVARRIQTVLNEGGIVDTMVHGISLPLRELPGGRFRRGTVLCSRVSPTSSFPREAAKPMSPSR